jgi:hypothetical protein
VLKINENSLSIQTVLKKVSRPDSSDITPELLKEFHVKEVYEYLEFLDKLNILWSERRLLDGNEE